MEITSPRDLLGTPVNPWGSHLVPYSSKTYGLRAA